MTIWTHGARRYEYTSLYSVPGECWNHEIVELDPAPDARAAMVAVIVPDTSGDGPFTPAPAGDVIFAVGGECEIPWPIMSRFLETVHRSGDVPRTLD